MPEIGIHQFAIAANVRSGDHLWLLGRGWTSDERDHRHKNRGCYCGLAVVASGIRAIAAHLALLIPHHDTKESSRVPPVWCVTVNGPVVLVYRLEVHKAALVVRQDCQLTTLG